MNQGGHVPKGTREELFKDLPNCWEVMNCGEECYKECPAYPDRGRECWKVTGTKCSGGAFVKATIAEKIIHCRNNCKYYREYVKRIYP